MGDFETLSPYQQSLVAPEWPQDERSDVDDPQLEAEPDNTAAREPRKGAAAYPYDSRLRVEMQVGLDKLRCVPDRELAQVMYELHAALETKWRSPEAKKWREEDERKREDDELARLLGLSDRAFKGEFGDPAKQLAEHVLLAEGGYGQRKRRTDLPALREFDNEFRKLRKLRVVR